MTSTCSAAVSGLPKQNEPNWPKRQRELFGQRYADLLEIRAELAARDIDPDNDDLAHFDLSCRLDDAERLVMTTHASYAHQLWQKIAVFEHALHGSPDDGDRRDNPKVWMFGCIKADLMALGVGPLDSRL